MREGKVVGIVACHVDDFIWGGDDQFASTIIGTIKKTFKIGKEESSAFKFIGINLKHYNGDIIVEQKDYVQQLQPISMDKKRTQEKDSKLTGEETTMLRSKIGQITWIAQQSRPDIAFDACMLAASVNNATVAHLIEANKIIRKIKAENVQLRFQYLGENPQLFVYSDASFGNLKDGGTQGGCFTALVGENNAFCPISWTSKKIRRVVRSTLAGETLAMADAADEGIFLATIYRELKFGKSNNTVPVVCITDSKSLDEAIRSNKFVTEKRLRIEVSSIKEMLQQGQLTKVVWVDTKRQLADCLTKCGASPLRLMQALEQGLLKF